MDEDTLNAESEDTLLEDSQEEDGSNIERLEKRYKDVQSWSTKLSQENKDLKSRLDQLQGGQEALSQALSNKEPAAEAKDWLDTIDPIDLIDNPDNLKDTLSKLRADIVGELVSTLKKRDSAISEQMGEIDPRKISDRKLISTYEDKISSMKEDPDFEGFSDIALAKIAHKYAPKKSEDAYLPVIGGHRASKSSQKSFDKEVDAYLEKQGWNKENGF